MNSQAPQQGVESLARRLESIASFGQDDRAAILALPVQFVHLRADQDIVRAGDRPSRCCLILEGFASVNKMTGDGRRQILAFQLAGDIPDLQSVHLRKLDSNISTLTACQVAFIRHEAVRDLCRKFPDLAEALWRATLIDASIFREWIANIGQREALGRVAHVLCETFLRLKVVGLANEADASCAFPISQQRLAEATGMSTVHVNRTLQALRANRLIKLQSSRLEILDWNGLKDAGDFDPEYLHLRDGEAEAG